MKRTLQLGFLSGVNILLVFLFQWYVLVQLGPGTDTDAFFASLTVPQLVLAVVSGSLTHVLVPLFSGKDAARLRQDVWTMLALVGGLFGLMTIVFVLTAGWWVPLTVPGFDEAALDLTTELARIQSIVMLFTAINGVQGAAYHARHQFTWVEFGPILTGILAFGLLVWLLPSYGIIAAAWIAALRTLLQSLLLLPGMGKPVSPVFGGETASLFWHRSRPLLLGSSYFKTDPLVERFLLSSAGNGNLSIYYFAQRIYNVAIQVLNRSIATPLVPLLSTLHKEGRWIEFRRAYYGRLLTATLIGLAGLVVVVSLGHLILGILMDYGGIDEEHIQAMWWIMVWLSGMLLGGMVGQICSSTFYACGDTRTPTRLSLLTYSVYIPAKVMAFYVWGLAGLAVTTSIYYMANLLFQAYLLEKKLG